MIVITKASEDHGTCVLPEPSHPMILLTIRFGLLSQAYARDGPTWLYLSTVQPRRIGCQGASPGAARSSVDGRARHYARCEP